MVRALLCYKLDEETTALGLMFLSAILFSAMGIFVKLAAESGISPFQLVFMRAASQGVVVLGGLFYCRVPTWFGEHPMRIWIITRGFVGGICFCFYFTTISLLPIGDAISLSSLYPIVTVITARLMLNEPLSVLKTMAIILSAVGAFLVAQPSFLSDKGEDEQNHRHPYAWVGYLTAMGGSVLGGLLFTIVRKAKEAHLLNLLWSWTVGSTFISLTFALTVAELRLPQGFTWIYVLLMCTLGTLAHFMMNYAGQRAPAGPSALLRSSDVLFAYLWEFLIFKNSINGMTIGGVGLICLGIGLVAYSKYLDRKKKAKTRSLRDLVTESTSDSETVEMERVLRFERPRRDGFVRVRSQDSMLSSSLTELLDNEEALKKTCSLPGIEEEGVSSSP